MNQASNKSEVMQWVKAAATIVPIASAIAVGGWWVGTTLAKSKSAVTISKLQGEVSEAKQQVELAQSREALATQANHQWKAAYASLQEIVTQQNNKVSELAAQLGRENNCDFVHQQIVATQQEISAVGNVGIWSSDKSWQQEQRDKQAVLEKRLQLYQYQLGNCNR